jgi:uncharacterized protein DUF6353
MNLVPKSLTRVGSRSLLKLNASSPTLLVVAGVGGLVATAFLASKASRKLDPILIEHQARRVEVKHNLTDKGRVQQRALLGVYVDTSAKLTKLYGPTLFVGTASVVSVLGGHKILRGRQIATMAAYSGLLEQFQSYRKRIADTLGEEVEKGIYEGARGEWLEDPNHKGEYKLHPVFDKDSTDHYLRPWYDETNPNWVRNAQANYLFLKGVQQHMNIRLQIKGHVFLNEVFDALGIPRTREGVVAGWLYEDKGQGDGFIDFGFMSSLDPHTIAFCNEVEKTVRLNFNIDGVIWDQI